jgi:hypothetical protein
MRSFRNEFNIESRKTNSELPFPVGLVLVLDPPNEPHCTLRRAHPDVHNVCFPSGSTAGLKCEWNGGANQNELHLEIRPLVMSGDLRHEERQTTDLAPGKAPSPIALTYQQEQDNLR